MPLVSVPFKKALTERVGDDPGVSELTIEIDDPRMEFRVDDAGTIGIFGVPRAPEHKVALMDGDLAAASLKGGQCAHRAA
jgi:hypothetical protein